MGDQVGSLQHLQVKHQLLLELLMLLLMAFGKGVWTASPASGATAAAATNTLAVVPAGIILGAGGQVQLMRLLQE